MVFEWDELKAAANFAKHRVSFEAAEQVWKDPLHVIVPDRVVDDEPRWHAYGLVGTVMILVVVHTIRGEDEDERIRIISARRATPSERKRSERG